MTTKTEGKKKLRNVSDSVLLNESLEAEMTCPTCKGDGKKCKSCGGAGVVSKRKFENLNLGRKA